MRIFTIIFPLKTIFTGRLSSRDFDNQAPKLFVIPLLSLSEIMNLKRINLSAQKIIHTIITILEQIIKTYPNVYSNRLNDVITD